MGSSYLIRWWKLLVWGKFGFLVCSIRILKVFLFGWNLIRRWLFRMCGRKVFCFLSFVLSFILRMCLRNWFRILFSVCFFCKWKRVFLMMIFIVCLRLLCCWFCMLFSLSMVILIRRCISLVIWLEISCFYREFWNSINLIRISGRSGFRCGMRNIVVCLGRMLFWNIWRLFKIWRCMVWIILVLRIRKV